MLVKPGNRRDAQPPAVRQRLPESGGPADIGVNLRRLRTEQGLSLEGLAKISGVSRAMLGQIETGKSVPTITLIWKVANALSVPLAELITSPRQPSFVPLPRSEAKYVTSRNGQVAIRALTVPEFHLAAEFFELRIDPGHQEDAAAYPSGTRASLVVASGLIDLATENAEPARLGEGDAILFEADIAHTFFNPGPNLAIAYLVLAPPRT